MVELTMPPIIGAAIRFITSAPVPWLHMIGKRPRRMAEAVIIFGLTRWTAPSMTASRRSAVDQSRPSRCRRSYASSRKMIMTTPVSAATPARAMMPTQTATLRR